jgi:hypothetical protein
MTLQALLFTVNTLKDIQRRLSTTDILTGLTLIYELPAKEHSIIQKEIYQRFHPAMEGYEEKDTVEVELLEVKIVLTKKQ